MEADSVSEETEQSSTMVEKGLPGIQMKFEDSKLTFNPEYHEEALHDKISLICSGRKVIKENGINFSEDKQCVYIEIEDIEDVTKVLKSGISLQGKPLVKEEIDLIDMKVPFLIVKNLTDWMNEEVLVNVFQEMACSEVKSVALLDNSAAKLTFADPNVCLKLNLKDFDIMGSEVFVEVHYEFPSAVVEEELLLKIAPLPTNIPVKVVENQLKRYISRHFDVSPAETKIIDNSAYLKFDKPKVVMNIASNPPSRAFHPGVIMSAVSAGNAISITEESNDSAFRIDEFSSLTGPFTKSTTPLKTVTQHPMYSGNVWKNSPVTSPEEATQHISSTVDPMVNLSLSTSTPTYQVEIPSNIYSPMIQGQKTLPQNPVLHQGAEIIQDNETNKVLIEDIPPDCRDIAGLETYVSGLMKLSCSVKKHEKRFLATFEKEIDFEHLKCKSAENTFRGIHLSFYKIPKPSSIILKNIKKDLLDEAYLKYHFEKYAGRDSIESIKLTGSKAFIKFCNHECVPLTLSGECLTIGGEVATAAEYYGFPDEDSDDEESLCLKETVKIKWNKIQFQVASYELPWLQSVLSDLNKNLGSLSACCNLDKNDSITYLEVAPLEGASYLKNWAVDVEVVITNTRSLFSRVSIPVPENLKTKILQHAQETSGSALHVEIHGNDLICGGDKSSVLQMENHTKQFIADFQLQKDERKYPSVQVYFLNQALQKKLETNPINGSSFNVEEGHISITANIRDRAAFWKIVSDELHNFKEKSFEMSKSLGEMLRTPLGTKKIEEYIGISQVYFYLEPIVDGYRIYFMSSTVSKDTLKKIKEKFKKSFECKQKHITEAQLHGCNDVEWKRFAKELEQDNFVSINVDLPSSVVNVSGEKIAVSDILSKINTYFMEKFSVTLKLTLSYHEWKVISLHFMDKLEAIRRDFATVNISIPSTQSKIGLQTILQIHGEKSVAESAKHRVEAIIREVCHKEDHMSNIPTARQLLGKMQDKIKVMENEKHASIDISIIKETSTLKAQKTLSPPPKRVCLATLKNEIRINVYEGSFTNHDCAVDIIVNFVSLYPSESHANLSDLKNITNGIDIIDELKTKLRHTRQRAGNIEQTNNVGVLKCGSLWHFLLGEWEGDRNSESLLLGKFFEKLFKNAIKYRTILLTTACSKPLHYPPEVFSKKLIESLQSLNGSPDLNVIIYVNTSTEATDFVKQLRDPSSDCRIAKTEATSSSKSRSTEKPVKSKKTTAKKKVSETEKSYQDYIIVEKGDMIQKKVDVLVNSTSSDMNLSNGMVSKILLQKCGPELQQECSALTPLAPGEVATTTAYKLQCKSIYHINLRSLKENNAVEDFKKSLQMLLEKAKVENVHSIAFPSLGVGNLGYSPTLSAKLICEEIMAFRNRCPESNTKYYLIIFDSKVYDEFKQEVIQTLHNTSTTDDKVSKMPVPLPASTQNGSTSLTVENANIAEESCDVIVNTTDECLTSNNSAVANAIMVQGGQRLYDKCFEFHQKGERLGHGDIKIMDVERFGKLKCKKVIHTHLKGNQKSIYGVIHQVVTNCLKEAEKHEMKSIALPALGLGRAGYSLEVIAEPMFVAFAEFGLSRMKTIEKIKVVILDQSIFKEFCEFFTSFFKLNPSGIFSSVSSYLVNTVTGKCSPSQAVNLASLDPSILDNLGNSLICINVYAPTTIVCLEIMHEIIEYIKGQCIDEPIQNEIIEHLSEEEKRLIKTMGQRGKVEIEIYEDIKIINITGDKTDVIHARLNITEFLREKEQVHTGLQKYQWKSIKGKDVEFYDYEDSCALEKAFVKKIKVVTLVIDSMNCRIDLTKFEESSDSGYVRKVIREERKPVPATWTKEPPVHGVILVDVPPTEAEYNEALRVFNHTIGQKVTIDSLQRVQNYTLYTQHKSFLESIKMKYPHKDKVTVKQLFHGSREESLSPIYTQGFNRNFAADANAAVFGCGAYFAVNANYSAHDQYSVPNKFNVKHIFICSVVIGEYTVGNSKMKVAPSLDDNTDLLYDTLVDNKDKPSIFVALTDGQAYPDYLVSFKVN